MYKLKKQKGITLVSLVITIIILLIISSIGINFGINGINSTKDSKLEAELNMVQHAVLEQYAKYKTTKDTVYLVGNKVSEEQLKDITSELGITLVNIPDTYSNKDYYKLDKASLNEIGIRDTYDEYIVNYISGEVINITQKKLSNNNQLYTKASSFN